MSEHPNAVRLRGYYHALADGDFAALLEMMSPDVAFHVPGDGVLAGEYRGIQEVATLAMRAREETGGTFSFALTDVLANDVYAVGLHRWTAERRGRSMEMSNINVYRFNEQGRIAERWEFIEDQRAHDDFWSV